MPFPSPPPLKTTPRPSLPPGVLNTRAVRLLTLVSIVFWMCVLGALGAIGLWMSYPILASFGQPSALAAGLELLFLVTGYWVGTVASRVILRDALKAAMKRNV